MGLTLLAIDSAGGACSAALWREGAVLAARRLVTERGHAQHLAPLVAAVLDEAGGVGRAAFDLVVATVGPGSFTGLRVGLALAQGVALAAGVPVRGVSSFRVHAQAAGIASDRPLLVGIDSRRDELFFQTFGDGFAGEPFMATPEGAIDRLGCRTPDRLALAGDGAARMAGALSAAGLAGETVSDGPADATMAAALAARMLAAGEALLPARPSYLRPPDVTMPASG